MGDGVSRDMSAVSEQQRAAWTERVESYVREARSKNMPFAAALVEMAAPRPGDRVLDVATGPGIVAIEAAKRVGPDGAVLATDFIPAWEPYVREAARNAGVSNIEFKTMPAEALELPNASFDVSLCQFGLMFMPEPVQALREMRRVLRPGGRLGVTVWSVPEKVGLFLVPRLVGAALPPPPEGEVQLSPMAMGAPGLVESLVAEAGFADVVVERQTHAYELVDAEDEWRRWGEDPVSPLAKGLATLSERRREEIRAEALATLEGWRDGAVIRVPSEAILVSAKRSQEVSS
jgi:SAM-dependent methyltransferase